MLHKRLFTIEQLLTKYGEETVGVLAENGTKWAPKTLLVAIGGGIGGNVGSSVSPWKVKLRYDADSDTWKVSVADPDRSKLWSTRLMETETTVADVDAEFNVDAGDRIVLKYTELTGFVKLEKVAGAGFEPVELDESDPMNPILISTRYTLAIIDETTSTEDEPGTLEISYQGPWTHLALSPMCVSPLPIMWFFPV